MPDIPQRPLFVCLGFLGSKPKHLAKYASMLSKMEFNIAPLTSKTPILTTPDVITYIPSPAALLRPRTIEQIATDISASITQHLSKPAPVLSTPIDMSSPALSSSSSVQYTPRKIIFYCLSNNGSYGYSNYLGHLNKYQPQLLQQINTQTAGVIWDSAPSIGTKDVFSRGFVSWLRTTMGRKPHPHDAVLTPMASWIFDTLLQDPTREYALHTVNTTLEHGIPYHAPQLYLLSQADDLIPIDDTYHYINTRSNIVDTFFNNNDYNNIMKYIDYTSLDSIKQQSNTTSSSPISSSSSSSPATNAYGDVLTTTTPISDLSDTLTHKQKSTTAGYLHLHCNNDPSIIFDPKKRLEYHPTNVQDTLSELNIIGNSRHYTYDFVDSLHVQHIRKYPEKYSQIVHDFSEYALRS